jgi:hypothetical protein
MSFGVVVECSKEIVKMDGAIRCQRRNASDARPESRQLYS